MRAKNFVRTKIVCTIGPSSERPEILKAMTEAGMDIARLNLSHGNYNSHKRVVEALRNIEGVSILVDLPGPKIRIGEVDGIVRLKPGNIIHFTSNEIIGSSKELSVTYKELPKEITVGESIFINDGLIEVKISSIDADEKGFQGRVVVGGDVSSLKGVNAPGASLSIRPPTEADLKGIEFGVDFCDWFAASFVRNSEDVENVKLAIIEAGGDQPVVSKIEHGEAVNNIVEIVETSDGIMIARGDLGVEIPAWEVPLLQKKIINLCNNAGKPVIVATQMLESMAMSPRPTRAEASDVANAILDGADAVMLSGETAVGLFPVESVRTMNRISNTVEEKAQRPITEPKVEGSIADVIGQLASRATAATNPTAIIVVTRSGFSARMVSKHRPNTRILSVARSSKVNRRTRLYWGVDPLDIPWTENRDELLIKAVRTSVEKKFLGRGDVVMIVSGSSLEVPGRTSTLEILKVDDVLKKAEPPRK